MPNPPSAKDSGAAKNFDRDLYTVSTTRNGAYFGDHVFVTEDDAIGFNAGGNVIVRPIREWIALACSASSPDTAAQAWERLRAKLASYNTGFTERDTTRQQCEADMRVIDAALASPPPSAAGVTQDHCSIKNMVGNSLDPQMHRHLLGDSTFGPLGKLIGEIFELTQQARKAGDERLLSFAHWAHERVCLARYEISGDKWPANRAMPAQPIASSAASMRERAAKVADEYAKKYSLYAGMGEAIAAAIRALPDGEG